MTMFSMIRMLFIAALFFSTAAFGQNPRIVTLSELESILAEKSGKIHIVNFWAT